MSQIATRAAIVELQGHLASLPQVDCPVSHHHIDGVYGRIMRIPSGTCLVGKIHKKGCITVLLEGMIRLVGDGESRCVSAPYVVSSPGGMKRAGYALSDVLFMTVHALPDGANPMELVHDGD